MAGNAAGGAGPYSLGLVIINIRTAVRMFTLSLSVFHNHMVIWQDGVDKKLLIKGGVTRLVLKFRQVDNQTIEFIGDGNLTRQA